MMPLHDGYSRTWSCDEMTVIYRPLTHRLRRDLLLMTRSVPPAFGISLICASISERVIAWNWTEGPSTSVIRSLNEWNPVLFSNLSRTVLGVGGAKEEQSDAINLAHGVRLRLLYPGTARLTCEMCQKWWVDPLTGEYVRIEGKTVPREGPLLCQTQSGCPAGTPEKQRRLSPKNQLAYEHYLECKATGQFPKDCWVAKNAKIIRSVEERIQQECRKVRRPQTNGI